MRAGNYLSGLHSERTQILTSTYRIASGSAPEFASSPPRSVIIWRQQAVSRKRWRNGRRTFSWEFDGSITLSLLGMN